MKLHEGLIDHLRVMYRRYGGCFRNALYYSRVVFESPESFVGDDVKHELKWGHVEHSVVERRFITINP